MASPQLEDGFTQIANEIMDHLQRLHLSGNQWQVLMCIIRKTYGFHKKVDYIANSQIVEATGLGKTVVSRALGSLNRLNMINRNGKQIGFQKDWEKWPRLAEQSTELAVLSIELAEQSTKVSSPDVTQKIKETLTKDIIQKKEDDELLNDITNQEKDFSITNHLKDKFPTLKRRELEQFRLMFREEVESGGTDLVYSRYNFIVWLHNKFSK